MSELVDDREQIEKECAAAIAEGVVLMQNELVKNGLMPENKAALWTVRSLLHLAGQIIASGPPALHEKMMARSIEWVHLGVYAPKQKLEEPDA